MTQTPIEEPCTDPLLSTATSLMMLGTAQRETNIEQRDKVAHMLKHHVIQIERDDFSGMEMLLTCQAQILHRIFTQAAEKYASSSEENTRPYGTIALKAQSYCRMTVNTLKQMKMRNDPNRGSRGTRGGSL